MSDIPDTSATLLRDLASDSLHARWGEFVARYRPMMEAYMRETFPVLDADEAIQETLIALIRIFPVYRYVPEEKGAFHNYLTGILRYKALKILRTDKRRKDVHSDFIENARLTENPDESETDDNWRQSVFRIALQQFLADETVKERTKEIFIRVAVKGEKPELVAADFGIARNAVDQIKSRSTARLKELVNALERACDAALGHD